MRRRRADHRAGATHAPELHAYLQMRLIIDFAVGMPPSLFSM
jgi:hypothetical protein